MVGRTSEHPDEPAEPADAADDAADPVVRRRRASAVGSGSAIPLRLPGDIPDMGLLPDGTPVAGVSGVYAVVGGRYPAGASLFRVEVEGMASIGAVVELLAAFDCVVESVLVSPGQVVRAGQVLAELRWAKPGAADGVREVATPFGSPWSPRWSGPSRTR